MLVTFVGTDLATLPSALNVGSQEWLEEFRKTTLRGGRGARKGHFRPGCEVSQLDLSTTVVSLVSSRPWRMAERDVSR